MKGNGAWVDLRAKCPYCDYAAGLVARDIRGQRFVLECLDCRETFVVEVAVEVTHRVRALADVDVDEVLERLRKKNGTKPPDTPPKLPPPAAAGGARAGTAAPGGSRSRSAAASGAGRQPLKTRRVQGHRYGPGARGES